MIRLLAIIVFIYVLYLLIRFAIRRAQMVTGNGRGYTPGGQRQRRRSSSNRFDHVEEAEYEEINDAKQSDTTSSTGSSSSST